MKPEALLQLIIAIGVMALMAFSLLAVAFVQIPAGQLNLFTALASGVIGGAFGIVVGFLFGSSLETKAPSPPAVQP
ncbi:MAG: hypothetical protein JSR98_00425 [Proteobacteria bacterium]|nr:hypothetical protein [Pseudomonadota bacterium]